MRCALRNQHKLIVAFGSDYIDIMIKSINEHFKLAKEIIEYTYESEPFKVIHVQSVQPNTDTILEFYVISKKFDMYILAYKSAMG